MNKNSIDRITFWLVIWILIFGNLGFGLTTMAFATGLDYLAPYGWLGMPPPVLPGVRAGLSFHASCLLATGIAFVVALAADSRTQLFSVSLVMTIYSALITTYIGLFLMDVAAVSTGFFSLLILIVLVRNWMPMK